MRAEGRARDEALARLRSHLAAAASFELERRGILGDGRRPEAASLVRHATEAALARILADLHRYRAQSAFTTWTAKYAIHEAAAAAREKASASGARAEE